MKPDAKLFAARDASLSVMDRLVRLPLEDGDAGQFSVGVVTRKAIDGFYLRAANDSERESFRRLLQETIESVIDQVTKE